MLLKEFGQLCLNCGCTWGSHHAGQSPWPYDYCPGTEGRMDWENNTNGTVFSPSGCYDVKEEA